MGISVEVEDYVWIRRIVEKENLARSSSDCVGISGEVEDCMRICRIVWREVKRGEERWEWSVEGDVPSGWRSLKMNRRKTYSYGLRILLIVCY